MAYEVLARKWRPQQFADVVAQEHVTRTLSNAIAANRIAHAYLFVGPRGIGKTSLARIFAKALNCQKGPTATPCDACDACREIGAGNSLDVLEIDGASNRGIDEIRNLRENVKYAPARGPYKIYIIDEVHSLTSDAFNALLKTLEEPPRHVKFIFATTEPQKIMATILSRCQRFDLRRIPTSVIVKKLGEIAAAEGVTIDANALLAVARGAEGGLRDAESALDQLIAFRGNTIAEDDVLSVFGLVARATLESLAEAVLKGDVPVLLKVVGELDAAGKDMQRAVLELLEHFRNVMVALSVSDAGDVLDLSSDQMETVRRHAALTSVEHALRISDILLETEGRLRYALSKRTQMETALIRCARAASVVSVDAILKKIEALEQGGGVARSASASAYTVTARPSPQRAEAVPPPPAPAAAAPVPAAAAPAPKRPARTASAADELRLLTGRWLEIIEKVARLAPLARASLKDARPTAVDGEKVVIGFDPEFAAEMKRMEIPRCRKATQNALGDLLGRAVSIEFTVLPESERLPADHEPEPEAEPPAPADAAPSPAAASGAGAPAGTRRTRQDWLKEPAVRRALETFNGTIIDIRE